MRYRANRAGLQELLRGPAAQKLVNEKSNALAGRAGDGFEASTQQGASRYRAVVSARTWSARRRNARDNTLVRVLG